MGKSFAESIPESFDENVLPDDIKDRFHFLELLASNDLSDTYLLLNKNTNKRFVLKRFHHTELHSESELLRGMEHPGLPKFEPHIMDSDKLFTLREYIEGISLDEFLYENPDVSADVIIRIMIDICDIVDLLHSQPVPVIHRDIKPSNIILSINELCVTLIDFGISRKYNARSGKDTVIVATQGFSPPEQYGFAQTDCRTDIYSIGAVIRYCFTGTTDRSMKIPDKELERIIEKCTALAPEARYQSISALKKAINKYIDRDKPRDYITHIAVPDGYDKNDFRKLVDFFSNGDNEASIKDVFPGFNALDPLT